MTALVGILIPLPIFVAGSFFRLTSSYTVHSLTQQAINKWESGKSSPDPEMIKNLADFFECSADYLVGRTRLPATLAAHATDPTPQDLEELLRSSNVQFEGAPLDETDKEEVLEFLHYAWNKLRAKK